MNRPQPRFRCDEKASHCIDGEDTNEDVRMDDDRPLEDFHLPGLGWIYWSGSEKSSSEEGFF